MDKLKPYIDAVKKYHFWVICGATLLIALVCWYMATSGLAGQFEKRKSKIDSSFSGVTGVQPGHPNQALIDEIKNHHEELKKVVFDAWEILYREQKEKNPFPTEELGEDFKRQFENLRPKEELARRYRERYQNYIKNRFPKLLQMIDVRRPVEEKADEQTGEAAADPPPRGGMAAGGEIGPRGMAANTEQEWVGVIDWNQDDYAKLLQRFDWQQTPSTLGVVLAQEDLWVYEALLRVIKNTNAGATNQRNASVKRIVALEIGREAVKSWSSAANALGLQSEQGEKGLGGLGGLDDMGEMGPGGPGQMMDAPEPMGAEPGMGLGMEPGGAREDDPEENTTRQLVEFRYIDENGKPSPYQPRYPYVKHPYAEFKMMPVRMSLVMDQRRLPKLLVQCANSNMPIEVRRVRFLKSEPQSTGTAGMHGGMGGERRYPTGGMEMGGAYRPSMGGMTDGGYAQPGGGAAPQEVGQFDAPVEIHAAIYIYNPPDREKLGTGAASDAQPGGANAPPPPAPGPEM